MDATSSDAPAAPTPTTPTTPTTTTRGPAPALSPNARQRMQISLAIAVGLILAAAGVLDGLVMAFERRVVTCENGHYFPQGTSDFRCFSHPQAGPGIAIVLFSLMLAIVISLAGATAGWVLAARESD